MKGRKQNVEKFRCSMKEFGLRQRGSAKRSEQDLIKMTSCFGKFNIYLFIYFALPLPPF